jgi:hypothetical protein
MFASSWRVFYNGLGFCQRGKKGLTHGVYRLKQALFLPPWEKYEDYCLLGDMEELGKREPSATASWVKEAMGGRSFNSLQKVQETLDRVVSKRNNTPLDDFCGLSPAQIHRFLYGPFGEESPARYSFELTNLPETPILRILKQIFMGLSQGDPRMAAKGNLPAALSRAVAPRSKKIN